MPRTIAVLLLVLLAGDTQTKAVIKGMELKYPSYLALALPVPKDDALVLTNFAGRYLHGGLIPKNGVEITVMLEDKKGKSLEQIVREDYPAGPMISSTLIRIDGVTATRIVCEDDFQAFKLAEIRVYVERGPLIYKFVLATYPDVPNRKSFEASFEGILRTVRFVK